MRHSYGSQLICASIAAEDGTTIDSIRRDYDISAHHRDLRGD